MKNLIKKWWFWLIILIVIIVVNLIVKEYVEGKKAEETMKDIGESATNFYNEIQSAEGYGNYFTYNYETGEAEYHPPITIETYNRVKEGMTEKQVISILGNGEKLQPEETNTYLMVWGDLNLSKSPYYRIHITFDSKGIVKSKMQMGLE